MVGIFPEPYRYARMPCGLCHREILECFLAGYEDKMICRSCFLKEKGDTVMKPKNRPKAGNMEMVKTDNFISGKIVAVEREEEHKFMFKNTEKIDDAVRFKFELEGYEFPHYSRWMTFSYSEKANLLNKYLYPLVEGITPDCNDFDLEILKDMPVKILWGEKEYYDQKSGDKKVFQFVDTIRPVLSKLIYQHKEEAHEDVPEVNVEEDNPLL